MDVKIAVIVRDMTQEINASKAVGGWKAWPEGCNSEGTVSGIIHLRVEARGFGRHARTLLPCRLM
jgi:hypothetical protein